MTNPTKTLMAMLAIVGLATTACKPTATDSGIRYVAPKDGLNMREEPSVTGKKMLTIPNGAQVQKLEEKPESFKIDNIEGKWTKISWQGKAGWVFGGFLSTSGTNQTVSAAGDVAQCKNQCEQDRITACIHINCGREGVVCLPNEEEDCMKAANEKAKECASSCS